MEITIGKFSFGILGPRKEVCGRVYIGFEIDKCKYFRFAGIHIFPRFDKSYPDDRWGLTKTWYDGPIGSFGIGPIALIVWGL